MWSDDNNNKYPMAYAGDPLYPLINNGMAWDDVCASQQYQHTIFEAMSNELSTPIVVVCPLDKRTAATNFTTDFNNSHVSYFAGLDADESRPGGFLAGDWNLTNGQSRVKGILSLQTNQNIGWTKELHNQTGNVAMGDGSVQQMANAQRNRFLSNTGLATNRLIFP
jgi:prepilin-type processing-associated H-X9-DG protein